MLCSSLRLSRNLEESLRVLPSFTPNTELQAPGYLNLLPPFPAVPTSGMSFSVE